jgi:hypothetical protein
MLLRRFAVLRGVLRARRGLLRRAADMLHAERHDPARRLLRRRLVLRRVAALLREVVEAPACGLAKDR